MTPVDGKDQARARLLLAALGRDAGRRRTLELATVRAAYRQAFPDRVGAVDARRDLADLLDTAAGDGLLVLPAVGGRSWDHTARPALPTFVKFPGPARPDPTAPPLHTVALRTELGWATQLQLTDRQRGLVLAVNAWRAAGGAEDPIVADAERSLEVFGDEKAISTRVGGAALWRDGRFDYDLLRCRTAHLPLPTVVLQPRGTLLLVENKATFWSLAEVLRGNPGPIAAVGGGVGNSLTTALPSISDLGLRLDAIAYFGDVDAGGLSIAKRVTATAATLGLPAVHPAASLFQLLHEHARIGKAPRRQDAATASRLVAWLPQPHRDWASELLTTGRRAAQETVGLKLLAAGQEWRERLLESSPTISAQP